MAERSKAFDSSSNIFGCVSSNLTGCILLLVVRNGQMALRNMPVKRASLLHVINGGPTEIKSVY